MNEFERVLLVSFPDLLSLRRTRFAPGIGSADQSKRELPADRVVTVQLAARKRVKIDADTRTACQSIATQQLELRRVVAGRPGERNPIGWIVGQAQPKAVSHHICIARFLVAALRVGNEGERFALVAEAGDRLRTLRILLTGQRFA